MLNETMNEATEPISRDGAMSDSSGPTAGAEYITAPEVVRELLTGFHTRAECLVNGPDSSDQIPIRLRELAQQYEREGKSYSFKCINVEENIEYFANLQEETAKYGNIVQNIYGRCF